MCLQCRAWPFLSVCSRLGQYPFWNIAIASFLISFLLKWLSLSFIHFPLRSVPFSLKGIQLLLMMCRTKSQTFKVWLSGFQSFFRMQNTWRKFLQEPQRFWTDGSGVGLGLVSFLQCPECTTRVGSIAHMVGHLPTSMSMSSLTLTFLPDSLVPMDLTH